MRIVFDIGGTKMRIGKSLDGKSISDFIVTETPKQFSKGLLKFFAHIEVLAAGEKIKIIAGGFAGVVTGDEIVESANLPNWANKNFGSKVSDHFKCQFKLENDAAIGGLGEAIFGAGKEFSSVIYLTIGTGVGGAWILDKKLQTHDGGFEPGHQFLDVKAQTDLEQQINTATSQEQKEDILAVGIHNALTFWPAEIIILGGGQIIHGHWSVESIKQKVDAIKSIYNHKFTIKKAELGDSAGLYGALEI